MGHALKSREYFLQEKLTPEITKKYELMAAESLRHQKNIEASDTLSFDQFLAAHHQQYDFKV